MPFSASVSVAGNVRSSPVAAFLMMTDGVASAIGVCPCCKTWTFAVHVSPAATSGCGLSPTVAMQPALAVPALTRAIPATASHTAHRIGASSRSLQKAYPGRRPEHHAPLTP